VDKTKVDDMLLEMIEPKIQEINKKFSNKGSLTQDDINTLLLKSQYNHINHLDLKLNEVTASVVKLEHRFENLEQKFINLEQKVTSDYKNLEQKLTSDYKNLEQKFDATVNELKGDYKNLEQKFTNLEEKVTSELKTFEQKMEATINDALNKNMTKLIMIMGTFIALFKIIDKF